MFKKSKKHLDGVDETYWQHMRFAAPFCLRMIAGGIGGLIHAICPALFQLTASTTVRELNQKMETRFASQKHNKSHAER